MFELFRKDIISQIATLTGVSAEQVELAISLPTDPSHGDLVLTVARLYIGNKPMDIAKHLCKESKCADTDARMRKCTKPVAAAKALAELFKPTEAVTTAVAAGPYVNFRLNRAILARGVLSAVHAAGSKYGWTNNGAGKRVVVEFSSPNIAKIFHVGHLRSTIIGNFIYNLYKAHGWDAISMNYLGDWGMQYGLLAVGFERYGSEDELAADPLKHLFDIYVKINAEAKVDPAARDAACTYFRKMEDGDEAALAQWQRFRSMSIEKYKTTYARLGVHFDVYSGESQVGDGVASAMAVLQNMGLLAKDDKGGKIVDLSAHRLDKAVVQKTDGTNVYITRDLGAAVQRYEQYSFDKAIYVVSTEQDYYLKQLFKIVDLMDLPYADRLQHVSFGLVKGMSTRKGTDVFLDEVLDKCASQMHDNMQMNYETYEKVINPEHTADVLGMSAVFIQNMSAKRIKDHNFSWDRMLGARGDTGPFLQYTHARLCSLKHTTCVKINPDANVSLLTEDAAHRIIMLVACYPDVLAAAIVSLEPCTVVQYLFKLCHAISSAWSSMWVLGEPYDVAEARMLMYWCARTVLGSGLTLLGLTPLWSM
ncbi:arginyl-tRNA synthetase [Coemansia spiralis]|nr:arginyl-tRNA synthetase [Coemansia spiralis]